MRSARLMENAGDSEKPWLKREDKALRLVTYAKKIIRQLRAEQVRVESDLGSSPIKARIAEAEKRASTRRSSSAAATWTPAT
jgi:hypothetical protein